MGTQSVTVTILNRTYKLTIDSSDEEALRKAAASIEEQARSYSKMYAYKDHQDLLAMVALTQITQLTKIQANLEYKDKELVKKLTDIDSVLTDATKHLH